MPLILVSKVAILIFREKIPEHTMSVNKVREGPGPMFPIVPHHNVGMYRWGSRFQEGGAIKHS